jgi:DNA-binding GntR family transcriptional regulator
MAVRGKARTLGVDVYEQIRDRILRGDFPPGTRLRPSTLGPEYTVSVSVVREALTRLSEQHLVVAEPNLGFAVPLLSRAHLDNIVQARTEIEGFAIRLSVEHGDLAWESAVIAARHTLERTPERQDDGSINPAWANAHARFHAQLLAGCPNDVVLGICASLFQGAELYRNWSAPVVDHSRDVAAEHDALARAAIGRDPDLAAQLLKAHIEKTRDQAIANIGALRSGPDRSSS